jgi:hypothetical protein
MCVALPLLCVFAASFVTKCHKTKDSMSSQRLVHATGPAERKKNSLTVVPENRVVSSELFAVLYVDSDSRLNSAGLHLLHSAG